jgi:hypothetical protein
MHAILVFLPAQRFAVDAHRRRCIWMYETTNEAIAAAQASRPIAAVVSHLAWQEPGQYQESQQAQSAEDDHPGQRSGWSAIGSRAPLEPQPCGR